MRGRDYTDPAARLLPLLLWRRGLGRGGPPLIRSYSLPVAQSPRGHCWSPATRRLRAPGRIPWRHWPELIAGFSHGCHFTPPRAWLSNDYGDYGDYAQNLSVHPPKNDPGKPATALGLRRETSLTVKAITAPVHLGTCNTATDLPPKQFCSSHLHQI